MHHTRKVNLFLRLQRNTGSEWNSINTLRNNDLTTWNQHSSELRFAESKSLRGLFYSLHNQHFRLVLCVILITVLETPVFLKF